MSIKSTLGVLFGTLLILCTALPTTLSANTPKKATSKPFLIQGKLPHLTLTVKQMWNDKKLALTQAQKKKLMVIRKETISGAQKLNKEIMKLETKIVHASNMNINPNSLKESVFKLANLRAQATMLHLKCIYNTRKVLTEKQLALLK